MRKVLSTLKKTCMKKNETSKKKIKYARENIHKKNKTIKEICTGLDCGLKN